MRVGIGYDVHAFVEGRPLILGGIQIPHSRGLLGHSDADVLLHAIIDAILGATGLGDIGRLFPDTDQAFKDISSIILLERVYGKIHEAGYRVVNVDAVVVTQQPKIAPYVDEMRRVIAGALKIEPGLVGIKGKTSEGLGFQGRGEGMSAQAVVLMESR